jgi:Phage integrase, N-terminal SAM-like domain
MSTHLSIVPRDERSAQTRCSSSPSPYPPSPPRFGNATQPLLAEHKPKLPDQVRSVLRFRHYSYQTEKTYIHWIKRFILFHHKRHPAEMGKKEIEQFLTALAVDRHVSAVTQN